MLGSCKSDRRTSTHHIYVSLHRERMHRDYVVGTLWHPMEDSMKCVVILGDNVVVVKSSS
jgi:hypothetical protein